MVTLRHHVDVPLFLSSCVCYMGLEYPQNVAYKIRILHMTKVIVSSKISRKLLYFGFNFSQDNNNEYLYPTQYPRYFEKSQYQRNKMLALFGGYEYNIGFYFDPPELAHKSILCVGTLYD
jgi:hypothetical protein